MTTDAGAGSRRPKRRSPAYPAINLETAIQRARQLYERERNYATPVETIASHWNYKGLNGPAAQTLAALKKYGLIEDEGASTLRKAKLSDLADVILVHPDIARRRSAVQEAALRPSIHSEMWNKYRDQLPSDESLRWELTRDRGFTETGATEFIPVYRATIAFAELASNALGADNDPAESIDHDRGRTDPEPPETGRDAEQGSGQRGGHPAAKPSMSYPIPMIGGGVIAVQGEFPITERDWDHFITVLTAMKPALVMGNDVDGSSAE